MHCDIAIPLFVRANDGSGENARVEMVLERCEREKTERGPFDARGGRVITIMKMHEEKLREAIKRTKKQR